MGASGQGIASALFGLWKDKEPLLRKLNNIGLPGVRFSYEEEGPSGYLLAVEIADTREDRKEASLSPSKSRIALKSPIMPS